MGSATADGRVARGQRSRRVIAEALIVLLEEGDSQPTARRVAERAGVSLRLVFHHFEDMEQVLQAAVAVQVERHWSRLRPIDPALALGARIESLVRQRAALYDHIAPVRRAAAWAEATSPTLRAELTNARLRLRNDLAALFSPEIHRAEDNGVDLLDAMELATSFETWDQLRSRMALGQRATIGVMIQLLDRLTADFVTSANSPTGGTP